MKPVTVKELIEFLKNQPESLPVAFDIYSEYALLQLNHITVKSLQQNRPDGWIHDKRPDKPVIDYLVFPVN